jgi:beta-glucosidase
LVLLKNKGSVLPLSSGVGKVAVIGSLADNPNDQLGSWATADASTCVTPLAALRSRLGNDRVLYAPGVSFDWKQGMEWDQYLTSILTSKDRSGFDEAVRVASQADVVLLFIGEPSALTGEASSRTSLDLPGVQAELVSEIARLGKPMVGVVSSGRPLTIQDTVDRLDGVLFTFNPGSMAGPAIVDTLFGDSVPSGKLPVTLPRSIGQVPIYYDHLPTGRPVIPGAFDHFTSRYLDSSNDPSFPFGFGLSYTMFKYSTTRASVAGGVVHVDADVRNTGPVAADETVQLYSHQRAARVARPVRELKGFKRVHLLPGETKTVSFELTHDDLAFWGPDMHYGFQPGTFDVWIAPDCVSGTAVMFRLER